jgi:hypothetical protein
MEACSLWQGEEFDICPKCGVGKMKSLGTAAIELDAQTDRVTGDLREYQCDNPQFGHPRGGNAIVGQVNEQEDLNESVSTKSSSDTDSSDNMMPTASNTSSPS